MKFTNRSKIVSFVVTVLAVFSIWFGFTEYRNHARCAARSAALRHEVENLTRDAHDQLRVGGNKSQVVRFFEEHHMRVTFGYGEASGDFETTGCAPFGCGADTARVGISVAVDSQGTVTGKPRVSGIYTDCL